LRYNMKQESEGFITGLWVMVLSNVVFLIIAKDYSFWAILFGMTFTASGLTIIRIIEDWYSVRHTAGKAI
jgi:hypothetical protein